jgi:hypothetical protein
MINRADALSSACGRPERKKNGVRLLPQASSTGARAN